MKSLLLLAISYLAQTLILILVSLKVLLNNFDFLSVFVLAVY